MIWFIRMARWARKPPSARYRTVVAIVLALALAIVGIEWLFGWPDVLTPERIRRSPVLN